MKAVRHILQRRDYKDFHSGWAWPSPDEFNGEQNIGNLNNYLYYILKMIMN